MKALRNLTHNGQNYRAGENLDHVQIVDGDHIDGLVKDLVAGKKPSDLPLTSHDLGVFGHKMTQAQVDQLFADGVIGNDNDPLPTPMDIKIFNYQVQEGDSEAEKQRKREQAASRADNVGIPTAPQPQPSQVEAGTPEDAAAAIAAANQAAAQAAANAPAPEATPEPTQPADDTTPAADTSTPAADAPEGV